MKIRLGLITVAAAAIAACQSGPASESQSTAAAGAGGPSEGPEMICRTELVAGSRVRTQRICSPAKFNTGAGDGLEGMINDSGNAGLPESYGGG